MTDKDYNEHEFSTLNSGEVLFYQGGMEMDWNKYGRIKEAMKEEGISQMLISDPVSACYLTGRMIQCMERMMVLYLDVERDKPLLVVGKLFPQNEEILGFPVVYFDDTEDPVEVLAENMRQGGTIGIDKTWPARFLLRLMELKVGERYVNASYIVDRIRQVKTLEEQDKMRAASAVNDKSMEELIPLTAKGMTEVELGESLRKIYIKNGATGHSFEPIVGYGDNGADPHHESDDSKGVYGDCVVLDIGCLLNGYCADMTRTIFLGKASPKAREIYEIVKEANRRGIEAVRPGARFCDVDKAARDYIEQQGYGAAFTHRTGHCIGVEVHEYGDVSAANQEVLKPGMIFSVEPGIYVPGVAGVRIEDLVLVTEDGHEVLNHFTRDLIEVPMEP